jgi:hypothetical protein
MWRQPGLSQYRSEVVVVAVAADQVAVKLENRRIPALPGPGNPGAGLLHRRPAQRRQGHPLRGPAPRMNSVMKRWIGSCLRELMDRTPVWNQRHLMTGRRHWGGPRSAALRGLGALAGGEEHGAGRAGQVRQVHYLLHYNTAGRIAPSASSPLLKPAPVHQNRSTSPSTGSTGKPRRTISGSSAVTAPEA